MAYDQEDGEKMVPAELATGLATGIPLKHRAGNAIPRKLKREEKAKL